jgi:hypothetical protein
MPRNWTNLRFRTTLTIRTGVVYTTIALAASAQDPDRGRETLLDFPAGAERGVVQTDGRQVEVSSSTRSGRHQRNRPLNPNGSVVD